MHLHLGHIRNDNHRSWLLLQFTWNFQLIYLTVFIYNEHQVINVQVPFLFKLAVDWLAALAGAETSLASFTEANATLLALFASPAAVLIGYGIARSGVSACTGKLFLVRKKSMVVSFPEKMSSFHELGATCIARPLFEIYTDSTDLFVDFCCQNCEMLSFLK